MPELTIRDWVDPSDQILGALQAEPGQSVPELSALTGRSVSAVRSNLAVMATHRNPAWVVSTGGRPAYWRLTDKGREVAEFRVRRAAESARHDHA